MGLTDSRLALQVYARLPAHLQLLAKRALSPTYTLGAVVVLRRGDGAVLLVCQTYRPGWALPGGVVERGEEPLAAAQRELAEELGVEIRLVDEPIVVIDVRTQQVDCVYVHEVAGELALRTRSGEIAQVAWFAPTELPPLQPEALWALQKAGVAAP